jgi:Cu/Ag efflux protein CusF
MKKHMSNLFLLLAAFYAGAVVASAQGVVSKAGNVSKSATITAIDHTNRIVTLKDEQGNVEDMLAGPEIKRFDELKVGDIVTFSYHAAVVYQIVKPGQTSAPAAGQSVVRGQGVRPSGAVTQQIKATVTIEAIDPAVPSVTVKTAEGHKMTAQVQDKKDLEGFKVGDQVEITFTEALMVTVNSPAKKK